MLAALHAGAIALLILGRAGPPRAPAAAVRMCSVAGVAEPETAERRKMVTQFLEGATEVEPVLRLAELQYETLDADNVASALHRLAVINKRRRAGRDVMLRDQRFDLLLDLVTTERALQFSAQSTSDVLWSCATLNHWPPQLLTPVLSALAQQLDADALTAQQLSVSVWSLSRLQCKPTRLLETIEKRVIARLDDMNTHNWANLLLGVANLNYQPAKLMPLLATSLGASELLASAKPVEVADIALALASLGAAGEHEELMLSLAARAGPDAALADFSSRQLVNLLAAFFKLQLTESLPRELLDAWVDAVRILHQAKPLLAGDARSLEASLEAFGLDSSWVKRSEMLNTWKDVAGGATRRRSRSFSDEELRATFESIDTDSSGDIDVEELRAAFKLLDPKAGDAAVEEMLAFADADGDMQVSFEEFKKIVQGET